MPIFSSASLTRFAIVSEVALGKILKIMWIYSIRSTQKVVFQRMIAIVHSAAATWSPILDPF